MFILNKGYTWDIVVHDVMVGMTKTTNRVKVRIGSFKAKGNF